MGWVKNYNISIPASSDSSVAFFTVKEGLVASGLWTVEGSGDGTSAFEFNGTTGGAGTGSGGAYDLWTSSTIAGTPDAWIVFQDPIGRQLLMQARLPGDATTGPRARIYWDFSGAYTSAGISATVPPAATTDEKLLVGTRAASATFGNNSAKHISFFAKDEMVSNVAPFHLLQYNHTGGSDATFGLFAIENPHPSDTQNYIWMNAGSNQNMATYEAGLPAGTWATSVQWTSRFNLNSPFTTSFSSTPDYPQHTTVTVNNVTSGDTSHRMFRGKVHGIVTNNTTGVSPYRLPNITNKDRDGITYVYDTYVSYFWSDDDAHPFPETPSIAAGVVESAEFLYVEPAGVNDVIPPVITINTPAGQLANRNASVTFDVTDDVALALVTVAVNFPSLGITELAYHNGSFRAPYTSSTLVGNTYTLSRTGGWPVDFNLDVTAVDAGGNVAS